MSDPLHSGIEFPGSSAIFQDLNAAEDGRMLVVAALGGNALLRRGEALSARGQRANARLAAKALARLHVAGHQLVVTHGNGPQVGLLALQQVGQSPDGAFPLDVLDAQTEGMIGYLIEQELENALDHAIPVVTLLTQIEVDADDPAFRSPTKFVGPVYERSEAERLREAHGWEIAPDGAHWRRVAPSPAPVRVPDIGVIRLLVDHGVAVICAGGGGIPVIRREDGGFEGVEAVVDKDSASALLALELGADALLLLTDVDAVYRDWGTPAQRPIHAITPDEAGRLDLPAGSMGPKVEAAKRFVLGGGGMAGIGALGDADAILREEAGTILRIGRS